MTGALAGRELSAVSRPPPQVRRTAWNWVRRRLFSNPLNAAITFAAAYLLYATLRPILDWALFQANWRGDSREACTGAGACWVFIHARIDQFVYGFYPENGRWRVDLAALVVAAATIPLLAPRFPGKGRLALAAVIFLPPLVLWLLLGGALGLPYVETREWGGLMVTVFMAIYGEIGRASCRERV